MPDGTDDPRLVACLKVRNANRAGMSGRKGIDGVADSAMYLDKGPSIHKLKYDDDCIAEQAAKENKLKRSQRAGPVAIQRRCDRIKERGEIEKRSKAREADRAKNFKFGGTRKKNKKSTRRKSGRRKGIKNTRIKI